MLYKILRIILRGLIKLLFKVKIHNQYDLPDGNLIVTSNHMSIMDPVVLGCVLNRPIHMMAKKELFEIPIFGSFIRQIYAFPVDRNAPAMSSIKESLKILKGGEVLGMFVEGTRVKEFSLNNAKAGVGLIAVKSKSDVVPIKIESSYKLFSRLDIYYRDLIRIEDLDETQKKDYQGISEKILLSIYDEGE